MFVSLKNLPKACKSFKNKDSYIKNSFCRSQSIEKPKKYLSLTNVFYHQEKIKKQIVNENLQILNLITISSDRKASAQTSLSGQAPTDIYKYDLSMINKYEENLDSSLSYVSEFDLEENENDKDKSFNSSDNDNYKELIIIKSSTKNIYNKADDEEKQKRLDKEWNEIQESLLNKDLSN